MTRIDFRFPISAGKPHPQLLVFNIKRQVYSCCGRSASWYIGFAITQRIHCYYPVDVNFARLTA